METAEDVARIKYQTIYDNVGEKEAIQGMQNVENKGKELGDKIGTAFNATKWAAFGAAIKRVAEKIADVTKVSADYIETLNVLQVAFDGNTESIRKFSSQLSDTLNLDDSTIISAAAHFKVLSKSMGIATETGEKLSKLLTQMTLDLSSLYNIDFDKAQSALQYAMEGRGTSLKQRTGVSVLETTVQTTLDTIGVDAYVEDMTDAEKAIARVIAMEYQLMSSQGDLARTIEAPANQIRVMKEQIHLLARNIGNVLLPVIAKILPYFNAILIVINAIISALARLVGYKEDMFDTFEESNTVSYFDGVGDAIDGVGKSAESTAKKLQGLRGFDKLNVIKTPAATGGASGGAGGGIGGINPNLLKAFNDMADQYKMKLEGVKTKATEIAEKILKWLGFAKRINKETGKTEWFFKRLTGGTLLGALGVGGFIFAGINKILKLLGKIGLIKYGGLGDIIKLFKDGAIVKNLGAITSGFGKLASALGVTAGTLAAVIAAIAAVIVSLIHAYTTSEEFRNKINDMISSIFTLGKTIYKVIEPVITTLFDILVPAVEQSWENIKTVIGLAYDNLVWVFSSMADIIGGAAKIITDIINLDFDQAFEDLKEMVKNVYEDCNTFINKIIERFKDWFKDTKERIDNFVDKAKEKLEDLVEWAKELPNKFFYWMGVAVGTIVRVITETDWLELGGKILNGIVTGVTNIAQKVSDFGNKMKNKISESVSNINWGSIGYDILRGIINGMSNFKNMLSDWASSFVKGIKEGLKIQSPSRLILDAKIGDFSMEAITLGMERQMDLVDEEAQNIVSTLEDGMEKAMINAKNTTGILPNLDEMIGSGNSGKNVASRLSSDSFAQNNGGLSRNGIDSQAGIQNATFVIQVGDETIAKKVLKDLKGMAKSNGKPITISG